MPIQWYAQQNKMIQKWLSQWDDAGQARPPMSTGRHRYE